MQQVEQLTRYLEKGLPRYLMLLESWVAVNSFTANSEGVNSLGRATEQAFAGLGFRAERIPSVHPEFGDHLVLQRVGSGEQVFGLVSHLDTVFPADEELANGFTWRVDGDRIYGPGTVDIKGGTLMMFMVLDAFKSLMPDFYDSVSWIILLNSSEETLSDDFGALCRQRLTGARACLVFEGGIYAGDAFNLVRMRKGMAKFKIKVSGKAAHAGVAHADGANAIVQLSETIRLVAALTDYSKDITFNVGYANGGTVPNRVPHYAEAVGEMRAFDSRVFDAGLKSLRDLENSIHVSSQTGAACSVSIEILETMQPWPLNPATEDLIGIWSRTAESLGYRIVPEARGGLSDGNHIWNSVPTLDGLGPSGGNSHCSEHRPELGKEQEYLYLPSLIPKAVLNVAAIAELLKK